MTTARQPEPRQASAPANPTPEHAAFANHLAFLSSHRARLTRDPSGWLLEGACPELSSWTPAPGMHDLRTDCPAVRPGPWAGCAWPQRLETAGYRPAERLCYMERELTSRIRTAATGVEIEVARTEPALREFAAVQAAGFADADGSIDAWWAHHFVHAALANRSDPGQTFYLARVGGSAVGTTLVVRAAGVAGIYAVATMPGFRCRGVARALLDRACLDATHSHGMSRIILQAMKGSYAESYYAKLGFRQLYELAVWRRA